MLRDMAYMHPNSLENRLARERENRKSKVMYLPWVTPPVRRKVRLRIKMAIGIRLCYAGTMALVSAISKLFGWS